MKNIKKLLIANRSEVALRINATSHARGIKTVGIYAPQDIFLSYVHKVDEAHPLSQDGVAAYLNQDEIINIALQSEADAIHPAYGFLSEKADFAQKVIAAGLEWIGPNPEVMHLAGDKAQAKELVKACNVPVIPGETIKTCDDSSFEKIQHIANNMGYPIILKDPLSGGGKAMKRVDHPDDLESSWSSLLRESKLLTGSQSIVIEKYLQNTRHIEIQIAGDGDNIVHLFERDCTMQRRHQKIIEESPCNFIAQETKQKLFDAALAIGKKLAYKTIGTIEFLVLPNGDFYFLEINPRLQVEHSVTELTTGIDLVDLQLTIIEENKLPFTQHDIHQSGHAIECRIYSEDPNNNFIPSTGTISNLQLPNGPFVRHEHDLLENQEITPYFDPMISKVITSGATREKSIKHMIEALRNFVLSGVTTNISFLQALLTCDAFEQGNFSTLFLQNKQTMETLCSSINKPVAQTTLNEEELAALATVITKNMMAERKKEALAHIPAKRWKSMQWK